jgi:hypothetical protein
MQTGELMAFSPSTIAQMYFADNADYILGAESRIQHFEAISQIMQILFHGS